jgi:formate hydrogenlyase subunit 6/NADH:ubiquinone oxidoreductase subunit I
MGHLVGKQLYRSLGKKIDGLSVRVPWNDTLYEILKELYSPEDAELIVKLPYRMSTIDRIVALTRIDRLKVERQLASVCSRGLVMDLEIDGQLHYVISPLVIGIFEFTMMRTSGVDYRKAARLFSEYLPDWFKANHDQRQQIGVMRAVPHEGALGDHVEVLDYEKATAIIEQSDRYAVGLCSCRHEHDHLGDRTCSVPLDGCTVLGKVSVEFMVRNRLAREVPKTEMLEIIARSRELGLVLQADNVQQNVRNMCHCCGCCCNMLQGISRLGYPTAVVTSSFIARVDDESCKGCKLCSDACPIEAIPRVADTTPRFMKHGRPAVDDSRCIGCGVCAVKCRSNAIRLYPREKRVLHPETIFEKVLLQCLEKGTLQNQLFDAPESKTYDFLRAVVGGFLRLTPVKQALMGDALRSRFLKAIQSGGPGDPRGRPGSEQRSGAATIPGSEASSQSPRSG